MNLEFKHLAQISLDDIIELNNHPEVLRLMPLGSPNFDRIICKKWVIQKEAQWIQHGYGPWAFVIDSKFAGWGDSSLKKVTQIWLWCFIPTIGEQVR
ncbi:hypothetical protein [Xenorhabdus hominickii]|uniref:Uncharacterized protein n=1 Tax=Xenorhabdus hominickii TaxID=351679 RepID=A0A2G0Q2T5_XENHO|nr:hypothetical protein [Xenorhabdus hominickii]PHM53528.1 hypothetical protein Xhom_03526 [Xenorhabdus hominickii]